MKKCISKFLVVLFPLMFVALNAQAVTFQDYEKKIKNGYTLRNAVEKLSRKDIEAELRNFSSSGRPGRLAGTPGHKKAQEYLENRLRAFSSSGVSLEKQEFLGLDGQKKSLTGINFVWEKKGVSSPDDVLVIVAHYDSLTRDPKNQKPLLKGEMPGADNNASGVALMISMIEIMNQLELPKTIRMVFLDLEELEAQGSSAFVTTPEFKLSLEAKKIKGVINLLMLAHDTKTTDTEKKLSNMKAYSSDVDFAKSLIESADRNFNTIKFSLSPSQSDPRFIDSTAAFKALGLPVVTFTQNRESDLNPRLWTSNDFFETLNINTYTNVFKALTSAVLAWNYDVVK